MNIYIYLNIYLYIFEYPFPTDRSVCRGRPLFRNPSGYIKKVTAQSDPSTVFFGDEYEYGVKIRVQNMTEPNNGWVVPYV